MHTFCVIANAIVHVKRFLRVSAAFATLPHTLMYHSHGGDEKPAHGRRGTAVRPMGRAGTKRGENREIRIDLAGYVEPRLTRRASEILPIPAGSVRRPAVRDTGNRQVGP